MCNEQLYGYTIYINEGDSFHYPLKPTQGTCTYRAGLSRMGIMVNDGYLERLL